MSKKRCVIVKIYVNTDEYVGVKNTPAGAMDLVAAMLRSEADLPEDDVILSCEEISANLSDLSGL